jgi:hypothetical protein
VAYSGAGQAAPTSSCELASLTILWGSHYHPFLTILSPLAFHTLQRGHSFLFCLRKAEESLTPWQEKARALNEPVKLLEPKVHLVAHPVGETAPRAARWPESLGMGPIVG